MKLELTISIDDKRSKVRTPNKSRNIKSAPAIRRSKSQLIITTKQKEGNISSSRPRSSVISVLYISPYFFRLVLLLFDIVSSILSDFYRS